MYVQFTQDVKAAVNACWQSVQGIHQRQEQNTRRYQEPFATDENKRLDEQKQAAIAAAAEKIRTITDKASADAAGLDVVSPLNLDTAAAQRVLTLLSGAFSLNVEQLQHVVNEYVGTDTTMQNAVATYCEAHGMKLSRATAESRRAGIDEIRASALSLIERIKAARFENAGRDSLSVSTQVDGFLQDGAHAAELCQRLGQTLSGERLSPTVQDAQTFHFDFKPAGSTWAEPNAG